MEREEIFIENGTPEDFEKYLAKRNAILLSEGSRLNMFIACHGDIEAELRDRLTFSPETHGLSVTVTGLDGRNPCAAVDEATSPKYDETAVLFREEDRHLLPTFAAAAKSMRRPFLVLMHRRKTNMLYSLVL